jgi:hypothetical protein
MAAGAKYLETRDVPLAGLTRFQGNPKRGDVEQIRGSIRRLNQYRSLVVRKMPDGELVILAGNHTYQALTLERYEAARCEIIECDDDTARRINLADNRLAEIGAYDDDALVTLLSYLDEDYTGTGYTAGDVDRLLNPPSFDEEGDLETSPSGVGDPVVSYQIVFDDETQQSRWYAFVRWLKRAYPDAETLGERLTEYLEGQRFEAGE